MAAPVLFTFDLRDLLVNIIPKSGPAFFVEGTDDEKFNFSAEGNLYEDEVDTAGNVYRYYNPDRRANFELNVPHENKVNEVLTGLAVVNDLPIPTPNLDLVDILVIHRETGKTYIYAPKSWITKLPDQAGKRGSNAIKWQFRMPFPQVFYASIEGS